MRNVCGEGCWTEHFKCSSVLIENLKIGLAIETYSKSVGAGAVQAGVDKVLPESVNSPAIDQLDSSSGCSPSYLICGNGRLSCSKEQQKPLVIVRSMEFNAVYVYETEDGKH